MSELSPAAQAVLDAWEEKLSPDVTCLTHDPEREALAAALRAAAEIVAPVSYEDVYTDGRVLQYKKEDPIREKLLAIATELEAQ